MIEPEVALLLPENLARRYRAIPVRQLEDKTGPRRRRRPDERHVLGRPPARARRPGSCLRRVLRCDRARDPAHPRQRRRDRGGHHRRGGDERRCDRARPRARKHGCRLHQPRHLEGARVRRLGHPFHPAAEAALRARPRRRRHARAHVDRRHAGERRDLAASRSWVGSTSPSGARRRTVASRSGAARRTSTSVSPSSPPPTARR